MPATKKRFGNEKFDEYSNDFEADALSFYRLTATTSVYLLKLEAALKEIGLDLSRWRVLMFLQGKNTQSTSALANAAVLKLPTMTRTIQRMVADGLVSTRTRASDKRVTDVTLTAQGRRARAAALKRANEIYRDALAGMSKKKQAELMTALQSMHANLMSD